MPDHRRARRGRHAADEIPRHLPAGRPRPARRTRPGRSMEKAFSFMARVRVPGGILTPAQWLALHDIAAERGNGTLRLTTRQTIQFHGIIKSNLRPAIQAIARRDAGHHRRLRRREPQRHLPRSIRSSRAVHAEVAGAGAARSATHLLPHIARLARDLDRRRKGRGRRGGGRADLRPHLPAAQIQDRHRRAAAQRCRCLRARHRLHRDRSRAARSSATTSPSAAAWA